MIAAYTDALPIAAGLMLTLFFLVLAATITLSLITLGCWSLLTAANKLLRRHRKA